MELDLASAGWERTDPSVAEKAEPGVALIPDSSLASRDSITELWIQKDTGTIGMFFESGVRVEIRPRTEDDPPNPMTFYKSFIESETAQASIIRVGDVDALAIEPMTDQIKENPGSINFVEGDIEVLVAGYYQSPSELLPTAEGLLAQARIQQADPVKQQTGSSPTSP